MMIETLLGFSFGLLYAMIAPQSVDRLKIYLLSLVGHEHCKDSDKKPETPKRFRDHD